jgi:hypothetical protein
MAKVTLGPIVCDARGKLGAVVFTRAKGLNTTREWFKPPNPASYNMSFPRPALAAAVRVWTQNLTDAQRLAWATFALEHPKPNPMAPGLLLTAQQWCSAINMIGQYYTGNFPMTDPPPNLDVPALDDLIIVTNTASPPTLVVEADGPDLNDAQFVLICATMPVSAGRLNWRKWLNAITGIPTNTPTDITSPWLGIMSGRSKGPFLLTSGRRIGVTARILDGDINWWSGLLKTSSITT